MFLSAWLLGVLRGGALAEGIVEADRPLWLLVLARGRLWPGTFWTGAEVRAKIDERNPETSQRFPQISILLRKPEEIDTDKLLRTRGQTSQNLKNATLEAQIDIKLNHNVQHLERAQGEPNGKSKGQLRDSKNAWTNPQRNKHRPESAPPKHHPNLFFLTPKTLFFYEHFWGFSKVFSPCWGVVGAQTRLAIAKWQLLFANWQLALQNFQLSLGKCEVVVGSWKLKLSPS